MYRFVSLIVCLFLALPSARAEGFAPFAGPRPLAMLLETDPWLMVVGSDTPDFVLYEDGQVIYRKKAGRKRSPYLWTQLTAGQLHSLKASLTALGPYRSGRNDIVMADVSDQPETKLYLNFDDTRLLASIYGMASADPSMEQSRRTTPLPDALRKLHTFLSDLEFKDAIVWRPKHIEVIVWPYDHARDASIVWPKEWPGLTAPTTIRKTSRYSIFMAGTEEPKVAAFLRTGKALGAVEIDGKKFAVVVRPVFPSEPVWRSALMN
jgi:hypothetical protein